MWKSTAIISQLSARLVMALKIEKILNFCNIRAMIFLQSFILAEKKLHIRCVDHFIDRLLTLL